MIIDIDSDNVVKLPINKKAAPNEEQGLQLVSPWLGKCKHLDVAVIVDESLSTVECGACHEKLNPIWVLAEFAKKETRWHRSWESMRAERERYEQRSRTKCTHCGKMTPISRN